MSIQLILPFINEKKFIAYLWGDRIVYQETDDSLYCRLNGKFYETSRMLFISGHIRGVL